MASNTLCGNCGAVLSHPSATCARCGMASTGPVYGQAWTRPGKSPITAAVLAALIPGMGHVYLGNYKKGLVYLLGTGALEFFGFDLDLTAIGAAVGVPMELGGVGLWLHGVWDAYHTAKRMRQG